MRNKNIDILKLLCAFCVVFIHCPSSIPKSGYFTLICRTAVPCFFIISGFFYSDKNSKKQIRKYIKLLLEANGLYLLWSFLFYFVSFKFPKISLKNILVFLIFNESPLRAHLWYLGAILYSILVIKLMEKYNLKKVLFAIIPMLLITNLILGNYSLVICDRSFSLFISRNWLFTGIPFVAIGMFMNEKKFRVSNFLIPISIVLSMVESYLLNKFNVYLVRDLYVGTIFLSVALVSFFLERKDDIDEKIANVGKKYSTGIYMLHPIVNECLLLIVEMLTIQKIWNILSPIIVFLVSILVLWIIGQTKRKVILIKKIEGKI